MSELTNRIAEGEGVSLDFKFRIDDQKKIARTLAAFANTEGGKLLIGVKDNGKIAGASPEEEYYMVHGAAALYCKPPVSFDSKVWQEGHHLVLEIDVPVTETKHKAKDEGGNWKFYHRIEDQTLLANKIVFLLWRYAKEGNNRPESFTEDVLDFIRIIEEHEPVSLSKLYRLTGLGKKDVNELLAALIHWRVVSRVIIKSGIGYCIAD